MACCLQCTSEINKNEQYYVAADMGPEIISVIEHNLGHQVDDNGAMCSQCFDVIMQPKSEYSPPEDEDYKQQPLHESNVCVWCHNSLHSRRAHSLTEGPERQFIAERIAPMLIPDYSLVCFACWVYTRHKLQQQGVIAAPTVDVNVCVWCLRSLAQTRRQSIPEGPERNEITARIYPREIPLGGLVCYACWVKARRSVKRAANLENQQNPARSNQHLDSVCAWCRMSLYQRQTHILTSGPLRDEVAARIYPSELAEHALVCSNCWARVQENVQIGQGKVVGEPAIQPSVSMQLDGFRHTAHTSAHCFVPACTNSERNRVPKYLRKIILKSQKLFVSENARVCNEHKLLNNWEFLDQHDFNNTFTQNEIESMLRLMTMENE